LFIRQYVVDTVFGIFFGFAMSRDLPSFLFTTLFEVLDALLVYWLESTESISIVWCVEDE